MPFPVLSSVTSCLTTTTVSWPGRGSRGFVCLPRPTSARMVRGSTAAQDPHTPAHHLLSPRSSSKRPTSTMAPAVAVRASAAKPMAAKPAAKVQAPKVRGLTSYAAILSMR